MKFRSLSAAPLLALAPVFAFAHDHGSEAHENSSVSDDRSWVYFGLDVYGGDSELSADFSGDGGSFEASESYSLVGAR